MKKATSILLALLICMCAILPWGVMEIVRAAEPHDGGPHFTVPLGTPLEALLLPTEFEGVSVASYTSVPDYDGNTPRDYTFIPLPEGIVTEGVQFPSVVVTVEAPEVETPVPENPLPDDQDITDEDVEAEESVDIYEPFIGEPSPNPNQLEQNTDSATAQSGANSVESAIEPSGSWVAYDVESGEISTAAAAESSAIEAGGWATFDVENGITKAAESTFDGDGVMAAMSGPLTLDDLVASGDLSFSGGYYLLDSPCTIPSGNWMTIASSQKLYVYTGGTLSGDITNDGIISFEPDLGSVLTCLGNINGNGYIEKRRRGTLVLAGTNTYSGDTHIFEGTLSVAAQENIGASVIHLGLLSDVNVQVTSDSTFSNDIFLRALTTATIDTGNSNVTLSGDIKNLDSGIPTLNKTGIGTLSLTGNNTYFGYTTVSEGTLALNSNYLVPNRTLTINPSAALTIGAGVTVTNGSNITNNGLLTVDGGLSGAVNNTNGLILVDPSAILTNLNTLTFDANGGTGTFTAAESGMTFNFAKLETFSMNPTYGGGYALLGWSTQQTGALSTSPHTFTSGDTLYAQWDAPSATNAKLYSVAGQTITEGGQAGTSTAPKTASITVGNSQATIGLSDIAAAAGATFNLYSNAAFSTEIMGFNTIPLTAGGTTTVYIKVTSQDGTTAIHYAVTATREAWLSSNAGLTSMAGQTMPLARRASRRASKRRMSGSFQSVASVCGLWYNFP